MKEKLLHTPEGVRDIYHTECKKKEAVEGKLKNVLARYGYQDIETPTFEFFDIFNSDTGTVSSREMFKFFDRDNNTLVLRPDMTPSIARSAAKYYSDCAFPLRLSYLGNTFLNNRSYQGKLTERTELGAELINDDSPEADAEGVIMMIDCFLAAGLSDFRIDIGQAGFYKGVMDALDAAPEVKAKIHEYVENKNSLGMEILLSEVEMKDCYRNILLEYNELYGDAQMLRRAKNLTVNQECRRAVERLEEVYDVLCLYGYEKYVSFDLGMVNHYDYYTGIIFRGYTFGTGDAIGKGGRYDNLLTQFGKDAPAIGFTILIDELLSALDRQHIRVSLRDYQYSMLVYERKDAPAAIALAMDLRNSGMKLELCRIREGKTARDYTEFAKGQGAEHVFFVDGDALHIEDFMAGKTFHTTVKEFRKEF